MDIIHRGRSALEQVEISLKELMEVGLKQQRYAAVAELARMAEGIAQLLQVKAATQDVHAPPNEPPAKRRVARIKRPRRMPKDRYPRFERQGDKLVKVGWSKKRQEQYEHRAPRAVIDTFSRHLCAHVTAGRLFVMEDLLPIPDSSNSQLPAYQAYLTLAWLRDAGAVEKKGRDGYVLQESTLLDGKLDEIWENTPSQSL